MYEGGSDESSDVEVVEFEEEVSPPVLNPAVTAAKNVTSKVAMKASGKPAQKAAPKAPPNDGSKKMTSVGQPTRPVPNDSGPRERRSSSSSDVSDFFKSVWTLVKEIF
jgi:hypothetical protein